MPLVPGIYGGGWGPLLGGNSQRPDSWQYQPTETEHTPNPPLTLDAIAVVTVALTGIAATASSGTLAPTLTVPVTGSASSLSAGSLVPAMVVAVIGASSTVSTGTLGVTSTVALAGSSATLTAGTPGVTSTVALTGAVVTLAAGDVVADTGSSDVTVALTGIEMTASAGSVTVDVPVEPDVARGSGSALLPPYRFRFPRRLELHPTPARATMRASVSLSMRYGEQGAPFAIAATLTATPSLRIASGGALSLDVTSAGSMVLGMFALPVPALTAAMLSSARAFTLYGCESLPVMAFAVSEARMGQMLNAYPEDADGIVVRVTVPNVSASVGLTHRTWRHEVRAIP